MKLNVAQELKQPGRIGRCHEEVVLARQEYLGNELRFVAPLTVDGEYFFDGEGFIFKGTATTKFDSECALFLNLPVFSRCSEGCKGFCPVCGCDLNTVQCSCVREKEKENPFSALEQLLYHDKEV